MPSLAQTGSVTCFATRECLDLISGKELDVVRCEVSLVELQCGLRED